LQELHNNIYFPQTQNPKYFKLSNDFDEMKKKFSKIARKYNIVLVTTLFEKRLNGVYHNTAVVFDSDGSEAGKYRKMHIPDDPNFYEKFYFTPGDLGFEPINTSVGKLGVLICWDQWFPEPARIMALKGADILIYPTAIGWSDEETKQERKSSKKSWINVQKGHAIANHLPIIAVNRVGFEQDESKKNKEGILFWGNSFVLNARGEILAKAKLKEEIIICDIKFSLTEKLRNIWPFFRDRRVHYYEDMHNLSSND